MSDDGGWKTLSSQRLFDSPWFGLRQDQVELPNGEEITYTVVDHPGYAMVVPLFDDGTVLLERVFRYTVQDTVLELPSGGLDGDLPEVAARRELLEETGFRASRLDPLGEFYGSNGISNEVCHLFLGQGLSDTGETQREATEQIEIVIVPFSTALDWGMDGLIKDAPSVLALALADRFLREQDA